MARGSGILRLKILQFAFSNIFNPQGCSIREICVCEGFYEKSAVLFQTLADFTVTGGDMPCCTAVKFTWAVSYAEYKIVGRTKLLRGAPPWR